MKKFNCEQHCVISHLCMEPCDMVSAAADGNTKRREPTLRDPMRIPAGNYNEELYRLMKERERGSEMIGAIREMQPLSLRLIAACLHADMSIADISRAMRDLPAGKSRLYEIVRARVVERESKRGRITPP